MIQMPSSAEKHTSPPGRKQIARNLSMECCKLIASCFVVFIHAPFPGETGKLVDCLARFAVPTFLMISGYFNYQAGSAAIARRLKHILSLILIGTVVDLCWGCIATELEGGSTIAFLRAAIPDPEEVIRWIVLHFHPYAGHLWYLNAIATCYLLLYAYTRFRGEEQVDYKPFYYLCLNLFVILFIFGIVDPANGRDPVINTRDGWLMGLPMFGIGLFIREYQGQIFERFDLPAWKLVVVILAGALFSVLQWKTVLIGIMPFGTVFEVLALMLLLVSHPNLPLKTKWAEKLVLSFGPISTWVYVLHLTALSAYGKLLQPAVAAALGEGEGWACPWIVLGMSLAAAVAAEGIQRMVKRLRKRKKGAVSCR